MQRIDQLILIFLGGAAAVYLLVSTIALLLRREFQQRSAARESKLYKGYLRRITEMILREIPPLDEEFRQAATRNYYRAFVDPLKKELLGLRPRKRAVHRSVIRTVITDLAGDLSGEVFDRLVYFAEELGLPAEIMKQLNKRAWWIRAMAARHLGVIKALDASDALIGTLKDKNTVVRDQSAVALLKILGPPALRPILWTSESLGPWERIELSVVLSEFGPDVVPFLLEAMASRNRSVVTFAMEMLGSLSSRSAVDPLLKVASESPDRELRTMAIRALGSIGEERAVEPLVRLSAKVNPAMRARIVESLGAIGSSAAVPTVLESLRLGELEEKIVAALALGRCGEEGERELHRLASSDDEAVRQATSNALEELGAPS